METVTTRIPEFSSFLKMLLLCFSRLAPSSGQTLVSARGYGHADLESQAGVRATGLDRTLSHASHEDFLFVMTRKNYERQWMFRYQGEFVGLTLGEKIQMPF